mgnify:CR=1 FL=1
MNKKILVAIISVVAIAILAVVAYFSVDVYNNKLHIGADNVSNVYVLDGITDEKYDMTEDEKTLVISSLEKLEFTENGKTPSYHMCIIVEDDGGKKYILKYSGEDGSLFITDGAAKTGFYKGADELGELFVKYETEYGHGMGIDYSQIIDKMQSEAAAKKAASSEQASN